MDAIKNVKDESKEIPVQVLGVPAGSTSKIS
jgi:hypothetical protein